MFVFFDYVIFILVGEDIDYCVCFNGDKWWWIEFLLVIFLSFVNVLISVCLIYKWFVLCKEYGFWWFLFILILLFFLYRYLCWFMWVVGLFWERIWWFLKVLYLRIFKGFKFWFFGSVFVCWWFILWCLFCFLVFCLLWFFLRLVYLFCCWW